MRFGRNVDACQCVFCNLNSATALAIAQLGHAFPTLGFLPTICYQMDGSRIFASMDLKEALAGAEQVAGGSSQSRRCSSR